MNQDDYQRLYDEVIAAHYDAQDTAGLLADSGDEALQQIQAVIPQTAAPVVIDLAAGTGTTLLQLGAARPGATLQALDLSASMLQQARAKASAAGQVIQTHCNTLLRAREEFAPASADLVLLHYVLSYVGFDAFAVARDLLRPGGYLSIATSTLESFRTLQAIGEEVLEEMTHKHANLPASDAALREAVASNGFEILQEAPLDRPLHFQSLEVLTDWGIKSGWLTDYLVGLTPEQTAAVEHQEGLFPLTDRFHGVILLARKR